jgi:hypothetical protein
VVSCKEKSTVKKFLKNIYTIYIKTKMCLLQCCLPPI